MLFIHDTEVALQSMAALVNTRTAAGEGSEHLVPEQAARARAESLDALGTAEEMRAFVAHWGWTGRPDASELAAVRDVRPRLAVLWDLDEEGVVGLVNELLAAEQAVPRLVDHDGWGWHLHAVPDEAPFASRMVVEAAMAMIDVVRAGEVSRLKRCGADDCEGVFVDLSRNRSKRFCSTTCGNRVAAAAYRERQSRRGEG